MKQIKVESLSDENVSKVLYHFNHVFGKQMSLKQFRNKYFDQYSISALKTCMVALNEREEVVGFVGAIPVKYYSCGRVIVGIQLCDLCVRGDYRGKKVSFKLIKKVESIVSNMDVDFIFGFTNQNSEHILTRLNWYLSHQMKVFVLYKSEIKYHYWGRLFRKVVSICSSIHWKTKLKDIVEVDLEPDEVENDDVFKYKNCVFESAWGRLRSGAKVWLKIEGRIMKIGRFDLMGLADAEASIVELCTLAKKLRLLKVYCILSDNHDTAQRLSDLSENFEGNKMFVKTISIDLDHVRSIQLDYADYDSF